MSLSMIQVSEACHTLSDTLSNRVTESNHGVLWSHSMFVQPLTTNTKTKKGGYEIRPGIRQVTTGVIDFVVRCLN